MASSNGWPYTLRVYSSTNLVPDPWNLLYSQQITNAITGFDGSNYTLTVTNPMVPGMMFFKETLSNFWGESGFSNTSSVPPLPLSLHTRIIKNP